MKKYQTIYCDPPWEQQMRGKDKRRPCRAIALPYPTMTWQEIGTLSVSKIGARAILGAHSLVKDDIPDGAIAFGVPAIAMREGK